VAKQSFNNQIKESKRLANQLREVNKFQDDKKDEEGRLKFLKFAEEFAIETGKKERSLQQERIKGIRTEQKELRTKLDLLRKQEEALQGGGQVNFLEAIQRGSNESRRVNIQSRARAQGAGRGNQKLLEENLQEQKLIREQLEEMNQKLDIERA
jgi:hypothetical protein